MKIAFSTLGCPDWRWSEIYSTAKDLKFDGIEIRGVQNELYVPRAKRFDSTHIDDTIAKLKAGNMNISMLTTGIAIGSRCDGIKKDALSDAKEYIDLARKLSCRFIRIMVSSNPQPEPVDMAAAVEMYTKMCEYGAENGVVPLIETNGVLADSKAMANFISKIPSENKGVLWDIHHPFRFFGESAATTFANIGGYVKYVHVKDSVMLNDKTVYRMMGYGDVPVYDALKLLKDNGYDSYISLEWVKRWNPDLEEAGIVFAHFMNYITFLVGRL